MRGRLITGSGERPLADQRTATGIENVMELIKGNCCGRPAKKAKLPSAGSGGFQSSGAGQPGSLLTPKKHPQTAYISRSLNPLAAMPGTHQPTALFHAMRLTSGALSLQSP